MKQMLLFATIVALWIGLHLVAKRYCSEDAALDQRAHARLRQREVAGNAVGHVYGSISASDVDYAKARNAAVAELDKMGQLSNDRIALGFIDDSKSELALSDQCHQVRNNQGALTQCETRLWEIIGKSGH
jgi:hypothetical protein